MTEQKGATCYILQAFKDAPLYLCVMDHETSQFHKFPISVATASRLAVEGTDAVHAAITGYSQKHAFQEVAAELSIRFREP